MKDHAQTFVERYSTPLLSDAAFRAGLPVRVVSADLGPLDRAHRFAGPVATVRADNDLVAILAALHRSPAGRVLVISNHPHDVEVALIGDLIATEARRRGLAGFIVDACVRDSAELLSIGVPVVSRGTIPIGPLKLPA